VIEAREYQEKEGDRNLAMRRGRRDKRKNCFRRAYLSKIEYMTKETGVSA
jgi:hypothetical protein